MSRLGLEFIAQILFVLKAKEEELGTKGWLEGDNFELGIFN